ncbi:MAG TPA: xanthine dehydrogenase family protein subunit M [Syntrophales bacterium]|mgnify:CR=1 FL=1|jgi:xanthine dehydrogenase FAD-binding subunit|nr:xanthine dehydrogenase family protein subunit M [Syntrophales bacterium]HQA82494.1 xanthine dehydrogenase family protein subunit M [Syntrophales bacterium]
MNRVLLPKNLPELWSFLENEPEARVYAGGTDLLVQMRARCADNLVLICLERIAELTGIREDEDGFWIGACTTFRHLLNHPRIREQIPVLAKALSTLGSPPIRNMATIGGNICTASPAGDTLPPLYVLDADLILSTQSGERVVPLSGFITAPGKTQLERGEVLTQIRIKKPEGYRVQHFEKVGQRKALACAIASMAALVKTSPAGVIESARIAWGSVGPTVVVSPDAEAALTGKTLSPAVLEAAADLAGKAMAPIDDIRATAVYRRRVAANLLLRIGT